jgi:hypothetical protein
MDGGIDAEYSYVVPQHIHKSFNQTCKPSYIKMNIARTMSQRQPFCPSQQVTDSQHLSPSQHTLIMLLDKNADAASTQLRKSQPSQQNAFNQYSEGQEHWSSNPASSNTLVSIKTLNGERSGYVLWYLEFGEGRPSLRGRECLNNICLPCWSSQ